MKASNLLPGYLQMVYVEDATKTVVYLSVLFQFTKALIAFAVGFNVFFRRVENR